MVDGISSLFFFSTIDFRVYFFTSADVIINALTSIAPSDVNLQALESKFIVTC